MKRVITPIILILCGCSQALADPPQYRIDLLGPASSVADINVDGEAVGEFNDLTGSIRAFVAGPTHPHELLPLPDGYTRSRANGINDAGVIVGAVSTNTGFPNERGDGVVWRPDGQGGYDVEFLGHLPGHTGSVATAINNRGDIVGSSIWNNSGFGPSVWFNSPEGVLDIETLLDGPDMAQDVNDNGLVVGFRFRTIDLDTMQSAGLPPDQLAGTAVMAVNNNDELAGYAANTSQNRRFAVRHTQDLGWEQLGGVVGASANWAAWDINDRGDAVIPFSVYLDGHGLMSLNSVLAPGQGSWEFCNCVGGGINNLGHIAVVAENRFTSEFGVVLLTPIVAGDFNGDVQLNGTDIDALVAEIAGGNHTSEFDLTDDGLVNGDDLDWWLAAAGSRNLASGNPYLKGDANLDGTVDGIDFLAWNAHKFSEVAQWTAGDFTANGVVDGEDFLLWNANKFTSADSVAAVPEPASILTVLLLLLASLAFCVSETCGVLVDVDQGSPKHTGERDWRLVMQKKLFFLVSALVLTTAARRALADPPQYSLQFLGEGIKVEGMNEFGLVTGWRLSPSPAQGFVAGPDHPFELLPLPSGFISSDANDINDAGVIVGTVHAPGLQRAAAWYPDGQGGYDIDLLGSLPGHNSSAANAINNRGDIIGVSFLPGAGAGWSVWFNSPSGIMNILELDAPSQAQEVNDNGLVVGFGGRTFDLDTLQSADLPPGQLAGTAVLAANSIDELAGYAANSSQNRRFAVRHTELGWEQLGGVVGAQANWAGWDINDQGDTVIPFAVYFDEHGLVNYSDLLAPGQGNWSFCNCAGAAINNVGQIAAIAEDLSTFEVGVVLLTPIIAGDFNGDARLNATDVDALVAEIAGGNHTSEFDLTDDGLVNGDDLDSWLAAAGSRNLASGNPYLKGDANLDSAVDGIDFLAWNAHKFSDLALWTAGDFTANGVIDGEDFLLWNINKFMSADPNVASVPEPTASLLWAWLAVFAASTSRGRRGNTSRTSDSH